MTPRYGLLVQVSQLLAQLFIDWCISRDIFEPFSFTVPRETVSGLEGTHTGILVTIAPVKRVDRKKNRKVSVAGKAQ